MRPMSAASPAGQGSRNEGWHTLPPQAVLASVASSADGLTVAEASRRLSANGRNELTQGRRANALRILFSQFQSVIIWVLIVAGGVSFFLGETVDAVAIFALVLLNASIGFYQEFKAEKSVAALKRMSLPTAKVLRGGQLALVPTAEIVTGDVLVLEAGDVLAADARLLESASLRCVEAALTGESNAVKKQPAALTRRAVALADRTNMVFTGTSVAAGTARAVVVATAMRTELGRIAGLLEDAGGEPETPLQKKLDAVGRILVWAAFGIIILLVALGLYRGTKPVELFMTSVSLAIAVVPEGLPVVVTVALSIGVMRMARRRALVRRLAAVETLGSTTVICTDKTGTLTVGEMTVRSLFVAGQSYTADGEGYGPTGAVRADGERVSNKSALLELAMVHLGCNNATTLEREGRWQVIGDPTEGALLAAGAKSGGDTAGIEQALPKQVEFPFDSDRKRHCVVRKMPEGTLRAFVNGAPGVVLKLCTDIFTDSGVRPLTAHDREHILAQTSAMAKKALRVIASARRDLNETQTTDLNAELVERELVFVGLAGMYDPPRSEAKAAIAKCHQAQIRVVMITGDHPDTAKAIAHEIGITSLQRAPVTGVELEKMSDETLRSRVPKIDVYARVTAEHKLRIVRALKATGAVVAMTGDGVNDAPAIKGADIGIAMGIAGTEVTKDAADIIITDDNFATIVVAVEEGRGIYDNIRKTLQFLLAGNTGELLLMTTCAVIGLPVPLLPIHLLWVNLVTDGLPAFCLATDPIDSDVMKRAPRVRSETITDRAFLQSMVLTGVLTGGVSFAVYLYCLSAFTPEFARTSAFAVLVFAELLRSFGARSTTRPVWRIAFSTNLRLVVVVLVTIGLQLLSQHSLVLGKFFKTSAVSWTDGLLLLAIGAIPFVVLEVVKVVRGLWQTHQQGVRRADTALKGIRP